MYQIKKPFPNDNVHYRKNIKLIGGVDLNEEKFLSEYKKRFLNKYPDYQQKNQPYYLNALASKQYKTYMDMVHGSEKKRVGSRNQTVGRLGERSLSKVNTQNAITQNKSFEQSQRFGKNSLSISPRPENQNANEKLDLTIGEINLSQAPKIEDKTPQQTKEIKLFQRKEENPYKSTLNLNQTYNQ